MPLSTEYRDKRDAVFRNKRNYQVTFKFGPGKKDYRVSAKRRTMTEALDYAEKLACQLGKIQFNKTPKSVTVVRLMSTDKHQAKN